MRSQLLSFIGCFFSFHVFAQGSGINCDSAKLAPVKAYFDGYSYMYNESGTECYRMERSYFQKNFTLSLSDTSYKIIQFHIVTDLADGSLLSLSSTKAEVNIAENKYSKMLKQMTKKSLVTVDNILVSKDGICFRAASFLCYIFK